MQPARAIAEANLHIPQFGTDTIIFDLKSLGTPTIDLTTPLPAITDPVTISGNTGGADRVELHGPGSTLSTGLKIGAAAPNTTLDHLVIDNFYYGISANASGFTLKGSFIGTNSTGTAAASASMIFGVDVQASGAVIGSANGTHPRGSCTGDCNLISGILYSPFVGVGVNLSSLATGAVVEGNFIGIDVTGTYSIPNGEGINAGAGTQMIGGHSSPAQGNVLSGNTSSEIEVSGSPAAATIEGNFIGTNSAGTAAVAGSGSGVFLGAGSDGSVIGGTAPGAGNLISGASHGAGVSTYQPTNVHVLGNLIGTAADGVSPLPNAGAGVAMGWSSKNIIGGTGPGQGNTIAFNGGDGVRVDGLGGTATIGNTIRGNSIHDNTGEGIENINGGNNELTPPTIVAAGPLTGTACADCIVHVYSDNADEGRIYQGATLADGSGNWTFNGALTGPNVTATATDAGNTSEFSAPFTLPATPTPTPSPSQSPSPTPTNTASATPANTGSPTPTHTASPTQTATPTGHPSPTVSPCGSSRYKGDADGNGHVDINDVLATLSVIAGVHPGAACAALAEVDCDGELAADDALRILDFVAGAPLAQPTNCPDVGTLT